MNKKSVCLVVAASLMFGSFGPLTVQASVGGTSFEYEKLSGFNMGESNEKESDSEESGDPGGIWKILNASAGLNGQISNVVVEEAPPSDVNVSAKRLQAMETLIQNDIKYGFPGCQLAVIKDGKMIVNSAYGSTVAYGEGGVRVTDSAPVTTNTLFDLASCTKIYAVNYAIQMLVSQRKLSLSDKVSKYIPGFSDPEGALITGKEDITVEDLLKHRAGFPYSYEFYSEILPPNVEEEHLVVNPMFYQGKNNMITAINALPLEYKTGTMTMYSDLDFVIAGLIVEAVTGEAMDTFVENEIYKPLDLSRIAFNPLDKGFEKDEIAATTFDGNLCGGAQNFGNCREELLQGDVHDELAWYCMDGVSGDAGLFSNAEDLAILSQVMLNGGSYGDVELFDPLTAEIFMNMDNQEDLYALGWRNMADSGYVYLHREQVSDRTVGHTGWTGTMTWIDQSNDLVIVLLTNKMNSPYLYADNSSDAYVASYMNVGEFNVVLEMIYSAIFRDEYTTTGLLCQLLEDRLDSMGQFASYWNEGEVRAVKSLSDTLETYIDEGSDKEANRARGLIERADNVVDTWGGI